MKRTAVQVVRRYGWAPKLFRSALAALEPVPESSAASAEASALGAELLAQLKEVATQASTKDKDAIWNALDWARDDRRLSTSPRMYPVARILFHRDRVKCLRQFCEDPAGILIELLDELHPRDRSDEALNELAVHRAAISALGELATPQAWRFLASWLVYSDICDLTEDGVFDTLKKSAGEAAHTAIIEEWRRLPWSWRAFLLGHFEGLRHDTIRASFRVSPSRVPWRDRDQFVCAAVAYRDDSLISAIQRMLDFCLQKFDRVIAASDRPPRFQDTSEVSDVLNIVELLDAELPAALTDAHRTTFASVLERARVDCPWAWECVARWSQARTNGASTP